MSGRLPNHPIPGMLNGAMKNRIGLVVLVLLCLGLGIALITVRRDAAKQQDSDASTIEDYSNKLAATTAKWDDQRQVIATLYGDLDKQKKSSLDLSNRLTANLAQSSNTLAQREADLKASQEAVAKRDAQINELQTQNQALDKQAIDLTNSISKLTAEISETQRKLTASEGDKVFLEGQLKRLIAEKAELERQFNDLTVLRAQVAKLKQELNIARRIEWIRQGLFASSEQKGAQKLMQGISAPQMQAKASKIPYDLNVEVSADGSVKVIPPGPASGATNAPPAK
jgi:chromosome segregation ATPase